MTLEPPAYDFDSIEHRIRCLINEMSRSDPGIKRGIENTLWIALQLNEPPSSEKYMDRIHPNYFPAEKQLQKIIKKQQDANRAVKKYLAEGMPKARSNAPGSHPPEAA